MEEIAILVVTVVLVTCSFMDHEFVRIGYYVNNEYTEPYEEGTLPNPIDISKLRRNILAAEPRVTRFAIDWTGGNAVLPLEGTDEDDVINALGGADKITGGKGNDVIDGGLGSDTSIYSGKFSDYSFTRSSNSLKVSDIRSLSKGVGSKAVVMKDKVAGMLAGAKKGSYFLAGEYWNFEAHVDARISLRDAAGAGPVWNGKISKAGLASKLFNGSRKNPWNSMDGLGGGPLGLELTSTKGKNPVYRVGQSLVLLIKGSDDFFLNCFFLYSLQCLLDLP